MIPTVVFETDPARNAVKVYVYEFINGGPDRLVWSQTGSTIIKPGEAMTPFVVMPELAMAGIREALFPQSDQRAVLAHLEDTKQVRDRLLTMNEVRLVAGRDPQALNLIQSEHERRA